MKAVEMCLSFIIVPFSFSRYKDSKSFLNKYAFLVKEVNFGNFFPIYANILHNIMYLCGVKTPRDDIIRG